MPPGGQKRKRGDANYVPDRNEHSQRPSPHRPQNLGLAQHGQQQSQGYRGGPSRRGSGARGGRGGPAFNDSRPPSATATNAPVAREGSITRPMIPPVTSNTAASQPPPQAVAAPAASIRTNDPSNTVLPSFYNFYYLTEERIQAWQESGRQQVLEIATQELQNGSAPSILFLELIRAALTERLPAADAGSVVKDILESEAASGHDDLAEVFLDDVSISFPTPQATKAELAANEVPNPPALRELLIAANISPDLLRLLLENYVLIACGFVREVFGGKGIRVTTNELYRQRAYNLLREESEGYAKLLTEYFDASSRAPTSSMVADTYQRVMSLIGTFDLDPGRVLDVTLDAFANTIIRHNRFFIKYLRASSWWPVESTLANVQWSDKLVSALPVWAEPGYEEPEQPELEIAQVRELRQQRDIAFWNRLKEVGIEAWFELGGRRLLSSSDRERFPTLEHLKPRSEKEIQETISEIFDNNWIGATGELPPQGNRIAAQLLGFKLRFYASSTRDPTDTLPDVLMNLAALLIKVGFISLRDLFPHLYPSTEEEITKIKAKLKDEKADRERKAKPGGGTNALMAAGALTDDTAPLPTSTRLRDATGNSTPKSNAATTDAERAKEEAKKLLPDPDNQVVILLRNLLLIGAIPESLFLLGKFPWFMDLYPDLPQYVHRLFHHMLSKVYAPLQPLPDRESLRASKPLVDNDKAGLPKGHLSTTQPEPRKALRWARLEQTNMEGKDYIFYWDDWADNVPVCQTVDDVFLLCDSFINISGVKIGQDPILLSKLARIGKSSLSTDSSLDNTKRWTELSKRLLVPALSLTKTNSPVVNDIFGILQMWPIATRFNIYAEWTSGQTSRLPDIVAAVEHARAQTKDVLKRISKTNTRPMARELAKVADSNPGTVFQEAFRQIESYQNMIEVFVECARYLPALGYDVLTWSLMSSLGGNKRSRNQEDGMLTSPWLQALSEFAGSVFKRYPEMHAQSVLQYVAWQLKEGNSTDLVVLEQIIDKLAGIQCDVQMNDNQLQAVTGGPLLRKLMMEQLQDKRGESSFKLSTRRLLNALRQTDDGRPSQLVMLLLVLMGQEVSVFPSREEVKDAPLKVLGINLDRIYNIFNQYLELLRYNLTIDEFDAQVPDVLELIELYNMEPEIAWTIGRPSLQKRVDEVEWPPKPLTNGVGAVNGTTDDVEMKEVSSSEAAEQSETKTDMPKTTDTEDDEVTKAEDPEGSTKAEEVPSNGVDMEEVSAVADREIKAEAVATAPIVEESTAQATITSTAPRSTELLHPILKQYIDRFQDILPDEVTKHLPIPFYIAFWQLQLRDVFVPESAYKDERTKSLKAYEASLKKPMPRTGPLRDAKLKQDTELKKAFEAWEQELKAEETRCNAVKTRLRYEKELWFYDYRNQEAHLLLHKALWQDCFFPRILQSGADAHYAFHMMMFLHNSGGSYGKASDGTLQHAEPVSGFRLARLLDDIFQGNALTNMISALTNREAENFGRFLVKLLDKLHGWHKDRSTFENEGYGKERNLIGFNRKVIYDAGQPRNFMSWDDFRTILAKWNSAVFYALKTCLQSKEYMQIRNAILILKQVNPPFPAINFHNSQLKAMLLSLHEKDPRPDVKLTAMSCVGDLSKREKYMVTIQAFKGEPEPSKNIPRGSSTTRTSTPQPPNAAKSLNASAAEFKPTVNGSAKPPGTKQDEDDEEGEIDESKKAEEEKKAAAVAAIVSAREKKSEEPKKDASNTQESSGRTSTPLQAPAEKNPLPSAAAHTAPRTDTSRLSTAATAQFSAPPRSDSARPSSTQPQARPAHTLPNRPGERAPSSRMSDRTNERDRPEYGRLDRPSELVREDRRDRSSSRRTGSKSPERSGQGSRAPGSRDGRDSVDDRSRQERSERPLPNTSSTRESRPNDSRRSEQETTSSRPPSQVTTAGPHPDRVTMIDPAHPQRAALIHGNDHGGAPQHSRPPLQDEREAFAQRNSRVEEQPRSGRETRGERSSRRQPGRDEERPPRAEPPRSDRRDDRPPERHPPPHGPSRDLRDNQPSAAPTGPREAQRGPRDLFSQPLAPPPAPADSNHGRLSQDFAVPPRLNDPNYGRLNNNGPPTPTSEVPSGPRGRNASGRGGRNFPGPGGHGPGPDAPAVPTSPSYERNPPAGPSFRERGHSRRGSRDQGMPSTRSHAPSTPSTPAAELPPAGSPAEKLGIHPSRLQMIDPTPAPLQTSGLPSPTGPASAHPPSGPGAPRGPRGAPPPSGPYSAGPSPIANRPPPQGAPLGPGGNVGPPMSADRERRSDSDRRFAGVTSILQQQTSAGDGRNSPLERERDRKDRGRESDKAPRQPEDHDSNRPPRNEDRGASIRGRASRQASFQQDAGPGSFMNGPPPLGHPSGTSNSRPDLMNNRPPPNPDYRERPEQDERPNRRRDGGRNRSRSPGRDHGSRSDNHRNEERSTRSGRGPSNNEQGDRDRDGRRGRDEREHGGHRDGDRRTRASGRDDGPPGPMQQGGRGPPRGDDQHWNDGRNGEPRPPRGARGGPSGDYERGGGRGGDGGRERKRGRGGDEGPSPDMKRPRRNG